VHLDGPLEHCLVVGGSEYLSEHSSVEPVDGLVHRRKAASELQVSAHQGLHRRLQELERDASHFFQLTKHGCVPGQSPGEPGDLGEVDRHIGDSLQMQTDVEQNREQILKQIQQLVEQSIARGQLPAGLDAELAARMVRDLGEQAGRMVLTDPDHYTAERYERFVQQVVGLIVP